MTRSGKIDEEVIEASALAMLKANLAAKVAAIVAEKGDSITPPVFTDSDWVDSLSLGYNNRGAFVYAGCESVNPIEPVKSGNLGMMVTLVAFALVPKTNEDSAEVKKKVFRLCRAFREILNEKWREIQPGSTSPFVVTTLSPESVALQESSSTYWMGGVRFTTTFY